MKLNKKITSLAFAVALTLLTILSTTSCSLEALLENYIEQQSATNTQTPTPPYADSTSGSQDDSDSTSGSQDDSGSTSGSQDGSGTTDTDGEQIFYPDANNPEDIELLSPDTRTLLSTVLVSSKFDTLSYYEVLQTDLSYGSGVIYKLDREAGNAYIITNYHVVYNANEINENGFSDEITLSLYGMRQEQYAIPATVVGGSMNYDIAVLRVDNSEVLKNSMATAAVLGDSEAVRVFDEVFAVGNPEGLGMSATEGSVSVESESLNILGPDKKTMLTMRVMRFSAAVNNGNSGGGLYDSDGNLIGIVNAKLTGAEVDNIGYAIPINLAVKVTENILRNCDGDTNLSVKKALIGITVSPISSGLVTDGDGNLVIVEQVSIKGIQETCITDGLCAGDIINSVTIDGKKTEVTREYHLIDSLLDASVGSTVVLNITRGEESFDLTLIIPETAISVIK